MQEDKEGFNYPVVDLTQCIDCGLCEKICPVLNQLESQQPIIVYAAYNNDIKTRMSSSSGGIFTLLAENIIKEGGVVFGVRFDEAFNVRHDYTETIEGLFAFQGSKYVQSQMLDNYSKAKHFLEKGMKVLFSGTPCQIAGLQKYLRKKYENLITVDCVCHGVPSPMVWRSYLSELEINPFRIYFRDKYRSWKKYDVTIIDEYGNKYHRPFTENRFMQIFLSNLSLRPSCYNCPSKRGSSHSDITLGDFWGIDSISPDFDDDKGCSLIIVNTEIGKKYINILNISKEPHVYSEAIKVNTSIVKSVSLPRCRKLFMLICRKYGFNKAYKLITSLTHHYKVLKRSLQLLSK